MRLFVAVDPPAAAVDHLAAALAPLRDEWPTLRWSPTDQWHLTLAFLGEVAEGPAADVAERLARAAARTPAFELALRGGGAFPSARRGNVVWAGVAGDTTTLVRLAERAQAAARRAGIELDHKAYRPHLTLARAKRPPVDVGALTTALSAYDGPTWLVTTVRLVRSHLGATVRHETLQSWPLAGE